MEVKRGRGWAGVERGTHLARAFVSNLAVGTHHFLLGAVRRCHGELVGIELAVCVRTARVQQEKSPSRGEPDREVSCVVVVCCLSSVRVL